MRDLGIFGFGSPDTLGRPFLLLVFFMYIAYVALVVTGALSTTNLRRCHMTRCDECHHVKVCGECIPIPEVTGADLKAYRQGLQMDVDKFAGRFGTSRQHVAHLEQLTRPLTRDEVMSINLTKPPRIRDVFNGASKTH